MPPPAGLSRGSTSLLAGVEIEDGDGRVKPDQAGKMYV